MARGIISLNSETYVVDSLAETYVPRQSPAYRTIGTQQRENDPSINHFVHRSFPLGLGWARIHRDTGRGVGGLLDSTCWTALGPVTNGKLQETQTHSAPSDHFRTAHNFKGDLHGTFEEEYGAGVTTTIENEVFASSSDSWTGGGTINGTTTDNSGLRAFDTIAHKASLFVLKSGGANYGVADVTTTTELRYAVISSTDGATWSNPGNTGFPVAVDNLTTTITRRNNFDDDMGRLLSFGNFIFAAIYDLATDAVIEVYSSTDAGANWALDVSIPSGDGPKAFVDWYNLSATRSPVLITSEGVYSIDTSANTYELIYALDSNSNSGRWATVANDGRLYIGLSTGEIVRLAMLDSNVLEAITLRPGGDGLAAARQGHVNYMMPVGKWLMVAYGGHAASTNASIFMLDITAEYKDPETNETFVPWHHMWQDSTGNLDIVAMAYSTEDDGTARLHFAVEGTSATINYHIEEPFVNPNQSSTVQYQLTSVLRLPDDDMGDPHTTATVLQAFADADDLTAGSGGAGGAGDEYIELRYGLNGAADTTTSLGDFLSGALSQNFGSSLGVAARRIGINLLFDRSTTATNTPKLNEFELRAHHVLLGRRRWVMDININETANGANRPNLAANTEVHETIIANLRTVVASTTLVTFQTNETEGALNVRVPPDAPPVFNLEVIGSGANARGYRVGTVRLTVEEAI